MLIKSVKDLSAEFIENKEFKELLKKEYQNLLNELKFSLENAEVKFSTKSILVNNIACIFWGGKISFLQNKLKGIEISMEKVLNLNLLFDLLVKVLDDFLILNFL